MTELDEIEIPSLTDESEFPSEENENPSEENENPSEENENPSFTRREWCRLERISLATLSKLDRLGLGPKTMRPPGTGLVRIVESRAAYHARMLKRSEEAAAKREQEQRRAQASRAGKSAAKSPLHVSRRPR